MNERELLELWKREREVSRGFDERVKDGSLIEVVGCGCVRNDPMGTVVDIQHLC